VPDELKADGHMKRTSYLCFPPKLLLQLPTIYMFAYLQLFSGYIERVCFLTWGRRPLLHTEGPSPFV
jgi:hypothetical protein